MNDIARRLVGLQPVQQAPGQIGCDGRTAVDHLQHRLREVAEPGVLDQVTIGSQSEGVHRMLVVFAGGDHHHLGLRPHRLDLLDQVVAIAIAQIEVDHQHVELVHRHPAPALLEATGLRHQVDAVVGQQLLRDHVPDVGIVVHQQHAHGLHGLPHHEVGPHGGLVGVHRELPAERRHRGRGCADEPTHVHLFFHESSLKKPIKYPNRFDCCATCRCVTKIFL